MRYIGTVYVVTPFSGYIKDFQVHDPHRVGKISVQLLGRINDCRALTYRQDIKAAAIENYKTRALPTRQVCILQFKTFFYTMLPNTHQL